MADVLELETAEEIEGMEHDEGAGEEAISALKDKATRRKGRGFEDSKRGRSKGEGGAFDRLEMGEKWLGLGVLRQEGHVCGIAAGWTTFD